ncbi:MAG: hypothetical protein PWP65_330 [Clostridia bacterium]|nr:hypothetical protein [Clostridia bacterium]
MAKDFPLRINQQVHIQAEGRKESLRSLVQDVGEEVFTVMAGSGEEEIFHRGDEVRVVFYTGEARYEFTTQVLGRVLEPVPVYVLARPVEIKRVQAREFVRVKAALEVRYQVLTEGDLARLKALRPRKKAVSIDISGGGMQLVLREELKEGDLLLLALEIPQQESFVRLTLLGRVKRVVLQEQKGYRHYVAGVAFEDISERERDVIIGYVFRRLLEEMRKER